MSLELIKKLKNETLCSVVEAKKILEIFNWDYDKSLLQIKKDKTSDLVIKLKINIDEAFIFYKKYNGDYENAIKHFLYEQKNQDISDFSILDYQKQINNCESVYDVFDLFPLNLEFKISKLLTFLFDYYSSANPGELDNLVSDDNYNEEIKKALLEIEGNYFFDLFNNYLKEYKKNKREETNKIDNLFLENEQLFYNLLKNNINKNIKEIYKIRFGY